MPGCFEVAAVESTNVDVKRAVIVDSTRVIANVNYAVAAIVRLKCAALVDCAWAIKVDFNWTVSFGNALAARIDYAQATKIPVEKEALSSMHIQNEDLASCNKLVVMFFTAQASSTGVAAGITFASTPANGTLLVIAFNSFKYN